MSIADTRPAPTPARLWFHPKYAPVAPAHILKRMLIVDHKQLFGSYHLWLAHLVTANPQAWKDLQKDWYSNRGVDSLTIIMDNGVAEGLNAAESLELVKEATSIATTYQNVVIPVLPDVYGNGYETLRLTLSEYDTWKRQVPHPHGFMLVCQGKSWEDFVQVVDFFLVENRNQFPDIKWVGIPRRLVKFIRSRQMAVEYVKMVAPDMHIHLLGFSDESITDDMMCARIPGVRGIDTAVAVRYNAILTPSTQAGQIGPRGEWMKDGQLTDFSIINIRNVRRWIGQRDY